MQPSPSEQRLHPVAVVLAIGGQLKEAVFALAGVGVVSAGDGEFFGIPWQAAVAVVGAVLVLIPAAVHVLTFRYVLAEDQLEIRWGWLNRNERRVPYERIQSVDAREGLLHRMVGAVGVTIETGGGAEAEGAISAIGREAFARLREVVLARRRRAVASDTVPVEPAATLLSHLAPREALVAGLIRSRGMLLVASILVLASEFGFTGSIVTWLLGDDDAAGDHGAIGAVVDGLGFGESGLGMALALAIMALGFLVVVRVVSGVVTALRLHDHRLELIGDDLRTTCGAIVRTSSTTPIRRIQSLTIREGPWHRLLGRVTVLAATAAGSGAGEAVASRETLAPLLRREALPRVQRLALGGLEVPEHGWVAAAGPAARRVLLVGAGWWGIAILLALAWRWEVAVLAFVAGVVALFAALRRVARFRWLAFDGGVALRTGWLWRRTVIVRHDRIQLAVLLESPFDRRHRMARVSVDTAGQRAPEILLRWLDGRQARDLVATIDDRIATTEFRL